MDSITLNDNSCRICLKRNAILNWNDEILEFCGITYKDCYYKYTKLKETDSDFYPTNLCEMCANEMKNAHTLFEKALESFCILQDIANKLETKDLDLDDCNTIPAITCEITILDDDHCSVDDEVEEIEDEICSLYEEKAESSRSNSNETSTNEDLTIEPSHFIDIQNLELCDETPFHQSKVRSNKLPKTLATNKNHSKSNFESSLLEEEPIETYNVQLPKSTSTKKGTLEKEEYVISVEQNLSESNDTKSVLSATTKPNKKSREKYLLMCAYCSLKVEGACKLKTHEATHIEDRPRTEVCPQCGIKLYTKLSLTEHMKTHDENRQRNHKCEFCEKAFFSKGSLNVHRRVHLGLMVKCQLCPKEFFRQTELDKHLLSHSASPLQKNVGKKKYTVQCQYCNKSILTDSWKEHLAVHLDQPQVKCKICDRKFFARSNCTKHLKRVHFKKSNEYNDFIHYYVDSNKRMSNLIMKQQFSVQSLTE